MRTNTEKASEGIGTIEGPGDAQTPPALTGTFSRKAPMISERTPPSSPTTLYRLFAGDGALLYVGVAGNPGRRFEQHRGEKPWWGRVAKTTLTHYKSRPEAMKAELRAISKERPQFNVVGNQRRSSAPLAVSEDREIDPYSLDTRWQYFNRRHDFSRTTPMDYYWELNGSPCSDDYDSSEITAYEMWDIWYQRVKDGDYSVEKGSTFVRILWLVEPAGEFAPFQDSPWLEEDFLTFFTWPTNPITGEEINWHRVPVTDLRWTPEVANKGGFIQEATGWKPSPLQPTVDVQMLARAAGLA